MLAFLGLFEDNATQITNASLPFNFRGIFRRINTSLNYKLTFQEFSENLIKPYIPSGFDFFDANESPMKSYEQFVKQNYNIPEVDGVKHSQKYCPVRTQFKSATSKGVKVSFDCSGTMRRFSQSESY